MTGDSFYNGDASRFSAGTVLSRSFSILLKHPFVFVGLSFMAQIPRLVLTALTQNSTVIGQMVPLLSLILGLAIQGAVAYGVYEALRGGAAHFGKSLSRGMARVFPIFLATLSCFAFTIVIIVVINFPFLILMDYLGPLVSPVMGFLTLLATFALLSKWCVFIPACVIERLGPIESPNRSSILTKGCRLKIAGLYLLYWLCFAISFRVIFGFGIIAEEAGIRAETISVLQGLASAVQLAFVQVMTAVIYYELRDVKEGVSVNSLANVFD